MHDEIGRSHKIFLRAAGTRELFARLVVEQIVVHIQAPETAAEDLQDPGQSREDEIGGIEDQGLRRGPTLLRHPYDETDNGDGSRSLLADKCDDWPAPDLDIIDLVAELMQRLRERAPEPGFGIAAAHEEDRAPTSGCSARDERSALRSRHLVIGRELSQRDWKEQCGEWSSDRPGP